MWAVGPGGCGRMGARATLLHYLTMYSSRPASARRRQRQRVQPALQAQRPRLWKQSKADRSSSDRAACPPDWPEPSRPTQSPCSQYHAPAYFQNRGPHRGRNGGEPPRALMVGNPFISYCASRDRAVVGVAPRKQCAPSPSLKVIMARHPGESIVWLLCTKSSQPASSLSDHSGHLERKKREGGI